MANMVGGVGMIEPDSYYWRDLREPSYSPVTTVFYVLAIIIHLFHTES